MSPTITIEPEVPLTDRITAFLPAQGSFEVQHDQEGKTHNWHRHSIDETLFVIDGVLNVFWLQDGEVRRHSCGPNSKLQLPANTVHGSTAGEGGCVYLIAPDAGQTAETTFLPEAKHPAT
ncbi:hypothetical protein [Umezawaea sp. Da 62-37]|uniref:hypothetical protein n=1 Tax=Umezawaea sp. Da 62-37 TaxID=3075927 RepID=UPI0028F74670|nr:hypothetical protein [Umezawaea sp. Da 62-37]WNV85806.1 hypothetical protein RM788_48135 [Umezawaea sp. Da 62-37]